jgi:opacity protein-like surface antigen
VGISGRWSPFGDLELRATASFYDDLKVLRAEPSWRIPIALGLSIRPGVAVEDAAGVVLATGLATLSFDHRRFGLWVGGKYGDEVRPVLFAVPVVVDVVERIPYGAWAGVRVNASDDVRIHLSYAMDRLKQTDGTQTSAHTLSLGAAVSF